MNSVGRNGADLFFECSICNGDDGYYGQFGGRSLVKTSCDARHVFHLECITDWLNSEQELAKALDQRQCECRQPALPLIRMDGMRPLVDESPYCETQIFNYCRTGNLPELRAFLRQDETLANRAYPSVTTGHPEHLLAVALKNEHTDVVRLLIDYHADVNAVEHNGETPLQIAARMHRAEDFQMLIRAGADINNVLRTAVQGGDAPLLQYLGSTESGQLALNNALREAAERGQTQRLGILITAGANNLNDALRVATERGQTQCLRSLITAGANDLDGALNIAVLSDYTEGRRVLEQHGANIFTALNTAASESSLEFFKLFYERHLNETNEEGQTPLHITAANGHGRCLERMLEINAEKVNARNNSGETALHLAACNGHGECLRKMIEKGANLNATNNDGETALHLAARNGHDGCLRPLIGNGANLNTTNKNGETALHLAAGKGHAAIINALLKIDRSLAKEKDNYGRTALHIAARNGQTEAIQKLLKIDPALAKEKSDFGWTALHEAARAGQTEAIQELLKIDPSPAKEKNINGNTALDLAIKFGRTNCKKLLERYTAQPSGCLLQ